MIHVEVWQKPTQYCKAIILQLKINKIITYSTCCECVKMLLTVYIVCVPATFTEFVYRGFWLFCVYQAYLRIMTFFSNSYIKIFHFLILLHWLTVQVCTEVVIADIFMFFLILKGKLTFHYCYIGNLFLLDFLYLKEIPFISTKNFPPQMGIEFYHLLWFAFITSIFLIYFLLDRLYKKIF